jgi:DNA-binding CsgD family transcriptional regulator
MEPGNVIDRIYECAATDEGWSDLLERIADLAGGETAWLVFSAPALRMNTVIAPRSDPDIIAEYESSWWSHDPTRKVAFAAPVGRIITLADVGKEQFKASTFHNEFWRRSGHACERLASNLLSVSGMTASVGLQPSRTCESIEPELIRTFALLVPHLIRAASIRFRMRELELETALARSVSRSGAVLVDADCRVLVADDCARAIISQTSATSIDNGHLVLASADDTVRLHCLVRSCVQRTGANLRGGCVFGTQAAGRPLRIDVMPYVETAPAFVPGFVAIPPPAAMVVLSDPQARRQEMLEDLRSRFGLTEAEGAVALELLDGDGRTAAAERLGITLSTVRTHMMHIFAKMGVNSQAALVGRIGSLGLRH